MAIIKCKMCGGDIELSADKTLGVCEFCGSTMTLPKVDDEQRAAAFDRGNHFRRIGDFDKALTVYEALVRDNEADAEAHWCCALCRFGIEYVKDPASGEYMPTCHRASFDSFLEDVDTKEAIKHADAVARRQYEHDAQAIEEVRRGILTLSQNEKPYDVFICYKETDDRGQRTRDSQRAQEIYYQLTDQGRRVFFARITLEDKAGQQYEPYIFAALNSARVMIVVGTRREHLEAVWVKNEWSRFLALMKRDRKKLLIPCYADMDPYDMPEQLSVLQSYDMTKIGFIQDLTRGISKVLDADKKPEPAAAPAAEQPMMSGNVRALLKRGYMALEDGDWERADEFFEQVLNQDAECAEAYMGKALAEQKAKTFKMLLNTRKQKYQRVEKEELFITTDEKRANKAAAQWTIPNYLSEDTIRQIYTFRESYKSEIKHWTEAKRQEKDWWGSDRNITRARRYAAGTYKQELEDGYKSLIAFFDGKISDATARCDADKKAIEQKFAQFNDEADKKTAELYNERFQQRQDAYETACRLQEEGKHENSATKLEKAAAAFGRVGAYEDAPKRAKNCQQALELIRARKLQEETERREEEYRQREEEHRRTVKKALICSGIGLAAVIIVIVAVFSVRYFIHSSRYQDAEMLLAEGNYDEAVSVFGELGDFKDAADRVNQTKYKKAEALIKEAQFDEAIRVFSELGDYSDAQVRVMQTKYEKAEALIAEGQFDWAVKTFTELGDYKDAADRINQTKYEKAEALFQAGSYDRAIQEFKDLSNYSDSPARVNEVTYEKGEYLISKKRYAEAKDVFTSLLPKSAFDSPYKDDINERIAECQQGIDEERYGEAVEKIQSENYSEAFLILRDLNSFERGKTLLEQTELELLTNSNVGDVVYWGFFNNSPIKWKVIDIRDGKAFLQCTDCLLSMPYNSTLEEVTWAESSLRKYLNSSFLASAFKDFEVSRIVETHLDNTFTSLTYYAIKSQNYPELKNKNIGGENTVDKVFILGFSELEEYYNGRSKNKKNDDSQYLLGFGSNLKFDYGSLEYTAWLRNTDYTMYNKWGLGAPGIKQITAWTITNDGYYDLGSFRGLDVDVTDELSVLPVMWVDISQ